MDGTDQSGSLQRVCIESPTGKTSVVYVEPATESSVGTLLHPDGTPAVTDIPAGIMDRIIAEARAAAEPLPFPPPEMRENDAEVNLHLVFRSFGKPEQHVKSAQRALKLLETAGFDFVTAEVPRIDMRNAPSVVPPHPRLALHADSRL